MAEMALTGGLGVDLAPMGGHQAFGEGQGRYVVSLAAGAGLGDAPVPVRRLGVVGGAAVAGVPLGTLRAAHAQALPTMLKGEL
jgi:hypothetical protein